MSYTGSTRCNFRRIHICQYCGTFFDYPISKYLSVSNMSTEAEVSRALQDKAIKTLETAIKRTNCPHCGMYQNCMVSKGIFGSPLLRTFVVGVFILAMSLRIFHLLTSPYAEPSLLMESILATIPILSEILWQFSRINLFFAKSTAQLRLNSELDQDAIQTYDYTRKYYRSFRILLFLGFISLLIPFLGYCFGGLCLITCYLRKMWFIPQGISNVGFPLYSTDLDYQRS